jgi:copper chaperone CopZ
VTNSNFAITGMHCNGCVRSVTNALKKVAGVKNAEVSLQDNSAQVEYDEKETTFEEMRIALQSSGYDIVQNE